MKTVKNYPVLMMFLMIAATAFGQENKNQKIDYKTGDPASNLWSLNDRKITTYQQYVDTKKLADPAKK